MGRQRSASSTTRLLQVIFAVIWVGFLIYMVMSYMQKPEGDVAEGGPDDEIGTVSDGDSASTLTPDTTTTSPLKPFAPLTTADPKPTATPLAASSGPNARAILDGALAAYRKATAYSDRGVLKVSFRFDGRAETVEEYPWSTAWTKDGRLQLNMFDTKVRSDGKLLSCFVSEIRTENLKNQQLFLKGNQLVNQLYKDRIARYYLNGGERIPVNETLVPNSTLFAPPALGLLSGEVISPWLRSAVEPKRLADAMVDGFDCHVIQCPSRTGELIAWVDKKTSLIRQVKLPNALLDPMLAADPNVRDVKLFAKFSGASFDAASVNFETVAPRAGSWPVREFVAPADPLPTNLVGELAPEFTLLDEQRAKVTDRQFQGKPTAMLFVNGGDSDSELIQKLDTLQKTLPRGYNFAVVAGPNVIEKMTNAGSWRLASSIQPAANKTNIPILADLDGATALSFELASQPAVVTLDSRLNIAYADLLAKPAGYNGKLAISEKWDQNLAAAITAQGKGADVAGDMREKYRGYLDKYFTDRDQRLVAGYFPGYSLPDERKIAAVPAKVRRKTAVRSELKLNPRLVWESRKLTSPGNIALVPDSNRRAKGLLILDGWQTVSLFNVDGKPISRKRLELPEGVAVASIRSLVSANGKQHFAMFSVGGEQVHIFDEAMELVGQFPQTRDGRHSVLACEVLQGSRDSNDQLLVCFGGSDGANAFDSFTGKTRSIGNTAVRALALSGRSVLAADERTGALMSMDNGRVIDDRREYAQVKSGANGASVFAATAMSANREWSLLLLDSGLKTVQTFAISSAIFSNGLEPICGVANGDKGLWAVADSSNRIYLLSDAGIWLGDMAAEGRVSGMKLMTVEGRNRLVVSTDQKVECWELNFAPERVGSVGGRAQ